MGYSKAIRCKNCGNISRLSPQYCKKCGIELALPIKYGCLKTKYTEIVVAKRTLLGGWKIASLS